jgi:hypothetical protein
MKLKKEHVLLEMKYQELELASEDVGSSGHANAREVTKLNASTSCNDLIKNLRSCTMLKILHPLPRLTMIG